MNKITTVGVDEFTVVLSIPKITDSHDWNEKRQEAIKEFLNITKLDKLYKFMYSSSELQKGYTDGYLADFVPFYLCISWHRDNWSMGICVRFSAHAWRSYKVDYEKQFDEPINIRLFMESLLRQSYFQFRLSRIDVYADYKNFGEKSTPDYIYSGILKDEIKVVDYKNRNYKRKLNAYSSDGNFDTIYIGSKKSNTRCFSRVYDKKKEQISKKGFRYNEAINCDTWTRHEIVYKSEYAHEITLKLLELENDNKLLLFLVNLILQKFVFIGEKGRIDISDALEQIVNHKITPVLPVGETEQTDLRNSIKYIKNNSGLYKLFYKIEKVWDRKTLEEFVSHLLDSYENEYRKKFICDGNVNTWLRKNKDVLENTSITNYYN